MQVTELSRLGCDLAQGFHFSRPVPALEITRDARATGPAWLRTVRPSLSGVRSIRRVADLRIGRRRRPAAARRSRPGTRTRRPGSRRAASPCRWAGSPGARRRCAARVERRHPVADVEPERSRLARARSRAAPSGVVSRRSRWSCACGIVGSGAPDLVEEQDPRVAVRAAARSLRVLEREADLAVAHAALLAEERERERGGAARRLGRTPCVVVVRGRRWSARRPVVVVVGSVVLVAVLAAGELDGGGRPVEAAGVPPELPQAAGSTARAARCRAAGRSVSCRCSGVCSSIWREALRGGWAPSPPDPGACQYPGQLNYGP